MKEEALALIAAIEDPGRALNLLREYLQALALRSLHESEAFTRIAFVGGTALRFLHGLPRFSEDLDFSLTHAEGYEPRRWLTKLRRDLELAGFDATVTFNDKRTVHSAWVRISALLAAAKLAARPQQKLSIKLEIDTRPPAGAVIARTVIVRHLTFALRHHDLSSLMAGKVHALLTRPYAKGRDWFDLVWYRGHRPPIDPRQELLQNALDQTQGVGCLDATRWQELVRRRLRALDAAQLAADVSVFLERPADRALLTREILESALDGGSS